MTEDKQDARPTGRIHDMGMLDLRSAKTAEDLSSLTEISDVGVILIPEHLVTALSQVQIHDVGGIVPVPQGENVQVLAGQVELTGEMLAAGNPENVLILVGQVHITTPVQSIGYRDLRAFGQLFATRSSEATIAAKMSQFSGQSFYLPDNARMLTGSTDLSQGYLDLLAEGTPLIVTGDLNIEDDVTAEALRAKVPEIALIEGTIRAPKALLPLLQFLTQLKRGEIREREA